MAMGTTTAPASVWDDSSTL